MNERTIVVTADGGGVRVFLESRYGGPLHERTEELGLPRPHSPAGTAPGRVFDRYGHASHGTGRETPKDLAERDFLEDLAKRLPALAQACEADNLVLIAPPRALGVLRKAAPPAAQHMLRESEPKDRLAETAEELAVALRELRRQSA